MVSELGGLAGLIGGSSVAEQLLVWGVLNQLISTLTTSLQRSIETRVNANDPNQPLSPAELAELVLKGYDDEGHAASEAAKSGTNADRFHSLVQMVGDAPGPEALAEALRREIIPRDANSADGVGYNQGIAQSRLRNKWADTLEKLDYRTPGPETAVTALVRSMIADSTARDYYKRFGGEPQWFDLLFDIAGEGPSPIEAGVLLNRGLIDPRGTGPASTSFEQIVSESRFKNKYTALYDALREYLPPPRTVTAMLREGSMDEPTATRKLKNYGVSDADLPAFLSKAKKNGVQRAHDITEGEIIRLYTERGIDAAKCKEYLTRIGYSPDDADVVIAGADLEYQSKLTTATIAGVKGLYLHLHVDRARASAMLDRVGLNSFYRDSLLDLWDFEIQAGVKMLTKKEIVDMTAVGTLSLQQGTNKLQEIGYSETDARLIMQFTFTPHPPGDTIGIIRAGGESATGG